MTKHAEHWECDVPFGHQQATYVSCSRLLLMTSKLIILILIQKEVNWEYLLQFCNCHLYTYTPGSKILQRSYTNSER